MPSEEQKSRSSKPLMEKRRRARINESLLQLKNLVLDALNKNNPRHSKLEKADILEMTVRYLRSVHRQQMTGIAPSGDPGKLSQYRTGYAECMTEVSRYLNTGGSNNINNNNSGSNSSSSEYNAAETEVRLRLLNHLATQCSGMTTGMASRRSPQAQNAPVAPSVISTNNVQSMQVHIAGQSVAAPNLGQIQLASNQQQRAQEEPKEFISLRNTVLDRLQNTESLSPNVAVTVQPTAHVSPTVSLPVGTPGGEITLVLPQNLVQAGQLPTHLIPVYAPSPSGTTVMTPPSQPVTAAVAASNIPPSTPPRAVRTSVAYSNAVVSSPRDAAMASPGGAAFVPKVNAAPSAAPSTSYIGQGFSIAAATPMHHHQPAGAVVSSSTQLSTTSFSPMTIALPLQAKLVTTNQVNRDGGNHLHFHSIIPFQGAMLSPPHPAAPAPAGPDPGHNANPNEGANNRHGFGEEGNAEVKMDPMWRPW